jgi:hypothetical protein
MDELTAFPQTATFAWSMACCCPSFEDALAKVAHQRVLTDNSKANAHATAAAAAAAAEAYTVMFLFSRGFANGVIF